MSDLKKETARIIPPYKCKMCGMGDINFIHSICPYCGWKDDGLQNDKPDYMG